MKKDGKNGNVLNLFRPPIVAVLGHVDHGKTTLLDAIKNTQMALREAGGITQHIGAYQVEVETKEGKRKITFIDTPGHEAFSKMRSRGASVTDLVVLVVSAVEGVKPQTEESIKHIKKANVPFVVAATKMDLADASVDRVKKHLAKIGVLTEGYGGEIVVVPVSAVKRTGIKELLEMILLLTEMKGIEGGEVDLFEAVIIESRLDNRRGPLATVIVKKGILERGKDIFLGEEKVRVRAMFDEYGKEVVKAYPSQPVVLLGFKKVPPVGAVLTAERVIMKAVVDLKKPTFSLSDGLKLKIILKADTVGSLEAILGKLDKEIAVLDTGLGEIGEADILKAQDFGALVIGFNVRVDKKARQLAAFQNILVKTYTIIYELLDELYDAVEFMKEQKEEKILGRAKIIASFQTNEGRVAGVAVLSGRLTKGDKIKLIRDEVEVGRGRILNLRQGKEDVAKVEQGEECGARLSSNLDFKLADVLLSVKPPEIKLG